MDEKSIDWWIMQLNHYIHRLYASKYSPSDAIFGGYETAMMEHETQNFDTFMKYFGEGFKAFLIRRGDYDDASEN